jgi:subtilase family serine protease
MRISLEPISKHSRARARDGARGALAVALAVLLPGAAAATQVIRGTVPAAISGLTPVGDMTATQNMRLAIGLPITNADGLTNLLGQIYDPSSPQYRHYLTPQEFTAQFGPSESDYQALADWARAKGLTVTTRHANRIVLDVSGSVADIQKALHVTMRLY